MDLRENYCGKCDSGNLENGSCYCYQYFKEINEIKDRTELPCLGFINCLKPDGKNRTT